MRSGNTLGRDREPGGIKRVTKVKCSNILTMFCINIFLPRNWNSLRAYEYQLKRGMNLIDKINLDDESNCHDYNDRFQGKSNIHFMVKTF